MSVNKIAFIGGSGMYGIEGLEVTETLSPLTAFGETSSIISKATLKNQTEVFFLARHGEGHQFLPSEVNYRANIIALKRLGVQAIFAFGAVGSLQEEFEPGDMVLPDQFLDRTKGRKDTFFGNGIVAHVQFASPFCDNLRSFVETQAAELDTKIHSGATYVCMEGPQFSTRSESRMYRQMGGGIIGMTNLTEAKLAREAEIPYCSVSMVTDYDCWRSESDDVDIEEIMKVLSSNLAVSQELIKRISENCGDIVLNEQITKALDCALITKRDYWPQKTIGDLEPILSRFLG